MSGSESFETSIAPWLAVSDAQEAVDFYRSALGAVEVDRLEDHGRVVVAQLSAGERRSGCKRTRTRAPSPRAWDRFG